MNNLTIENFKEMLEMTGLPVAFRNFPKSVNLPYICFITKGTNNFSADGMVYFNATRIQVELYTKLKNIELEDKVENILSSFFWQKSEEYIDSEKCYQVVYELEM